MSQDDSPDGFPTIEQLEAAVSQTPDDAQSLVRLANAYWLDGRGPDAVSQLASRALATDPANRGAWHMWALAEPDPRARLIRWQQVASRFPEDDLAHANVADNAAALAGAEHDYQALDLAVETYERLRIRAAHPDQQRALDSAIATLRRWKF